VDGQDLDDLWALGFREVVLNDRYLLETDRDRLDENLTMLLGEPTFEEEGVMQVFALPVPGTRFQALSEEALAAVAEAEVGIAAVGQADAETLAVLVTRLQEAGYPARATVRLLAEVEARPDETWIREVLAESYAYRGLPALALASRAKARRLDPSSEEAPPVQRTPAALHPIATR
jgi:hypothetical protein